MLAARYVYPAIAFAIGFLALGFIPAPRPSFPRTIPPAPPGTPKVVVLAVFDQMKQEYLEKWGHLFEEGGFKRLKREGAWFSNCHYPYAFTLTGPGHASIATGTSARDHGIVANEWYDRLEGDVNCIDTAPLSRKIKGPTRRKQESFADSLVRYRRKSRVFGLSIKDRAAILLAALRSRLCLWLDPKKGEFVTSEFYSDRLPNWVKEFNKDREHGADRWKGKVWDRLLSDVSIYEKNAGPDDVAAEGWGFNQGRTFPHPFPWDAKVPETYYESTVNSTASGELLLDLTLKAIDAEKIGQRESTDLLLLGFSNNDYVGHCWGPDSQEVLDVTLASDRIVRKLLDALDAKVGKGNYVFAVSADHGVCRIPEIVAKEGKEAGRIEPELFTVKAQAFLSEKYGVAQWIPPSKKTNMWVYLNPATIKEKALTNPEVEDAVAEWLRSDPRILAAYTKTQLLSGDLDELGRKVRLSFDPKACGDVLAIGKPQFIFSGPPPAKKAVIDAYRTTHGSPHPYDTHVPFIVMGGGVPAGQQTERVTPQAMAATLSRLMRVPPPRGAAYPVPACLHLD